MNDIYTVLMSVPLLNGVSREKMLEITGKTKFHFVKYSAGEKIASTGEQCSHIKLLISGSVTLTTNYCNKRKNASITVSQTLDAPAALAVEYLFGIATTYPCDITAVTPVNVVQIEKFDYMKLISGNPILMLNYINALSAGSQNKAENISQFIGGNYQERFACFLLSNTYRTAKDITISACKNSISDFFTNNTEEFNSAIDALAAINLIATQSDCIKILSRPDFLRFFQ